MIDVIYDAMSVFVILVASLTTLGVAWMWALYLGPDNPAPRSRFLFVLCFTDTMIMIALWVLSWLAARRLQDLPSLGPTGGIILVGVILVLSTAHLVNVGYLVGLRRRRRVLSKGE